MTNADTNRTSATDPPQKDNLGSSATPTTTPTTPRPHTATPSLVPSTPATPSPSPAIVPSSPATSSPATPSPATPSPATPSPATPTPSTNLGASPLGTSPATARVTLATAPAPAKQAVSTPSGGTEPPKRKRGRPPGTGKLQRAAAAAAAGKQPTAEAAATPKPTPKVKAKAATKTKRQTQVTKAKVSTRKASTTTPNAAPPSATTPSPTTKAKRATRTGTDSAFVESFQHDKLLRGTWHGWGTVLSTLARIDTRFMCNIDFTWPSADKLSWHEALTYEDGRTAEATFDLHFAPNGIVSGKGDRVVGGVSGRLHGSQLTLEYTAKVTFVRRDVQVHCVNVLTALNDGRIVSRTSVSRLFLPFSTVHTFLARA